MKSFLTVILSIFFFITAFGQQSENSIEFFVINMEGAKVYAKPSFDSSPFSELKVGSKITSEHIIESNEEMKISSDFSLSGNWIKPLGINGFVFSSDLTSKKVEIKKSDAGNTYISLIGKLINTKKEKKLIQTENGEFPQYIEYKYFKNATYSISSYDGCNDYIIEYSNLSLNEVYHQMTSDYGAYLDSFNVPMLVKRNGNILNFSVLIGATEDLKIEIMENDIFRVSFYTCT